MVHPHHFRAFFVHGQGIEIVHLHIAGGADGVRHRAGVFGELVLAQHFHVFNAAHGAAGSIARKFLVAEHGQPFFERKLEPVAAGNAVTRPVVEIFVADDAFHTFKIGVGGGALVCQHIFGVEDVQAFVFHRAHIEIAHGHDHENIQIVFQPEAFFVPLHRVFQRFDGERGFVGIFGARVKRNRHVAPAAGFKSVAPHRQIARHQCKQISGLGKRVVPHGKMAVRIIVQAA